MEEAWEKYSSSDRAEGRAEQVEFLKQQCEFLCGSDRVLMELVLSGCSVRRLSELLDVNEAALGRRVRRLTLLLAGPCRKAAPSSVCPVELSILRMHRLERLSIDQIACRTSLSIYRVQRILKQLDAI